MSRDLHIPVSCVLLDFWLVLEAFFFLYIYIYGLSTDGSYGTGVSRGIGHHPVGAPTCENQFSFAALINRYIIQYYSSRNSKQQFYSIWHMNKVDRRS